MFEFNITLNDDDYLQFNEYHLYNSSAGKRARKNNKLSGLIILLMMFVVTCVVSSDYLLIIIEGITLSIAAIIGIVLSDKMMVKSMKKNIRKMKKDGKLPYSKEAILKFDDESIVEIREEAETKVNYSMVEKISVTDKAIYIYISVIQVCILPVTAFSQDTEKQKFLEFINSKVNI